MADIAEAAEVSRRTIYMYFPTLEHLLIDATLGVLSASAIDPVVGASDSSDPLVRIERLSRAINQHAGETMHLGPTEFRLLRHLLRYPGRVFSREQLLDAVWGHDVYVEPRTVDVHIRRLRKALNANGDADIVRTVRSAGYALDHPTH